MITAMGLASCSEEDGLMQGMSGDAIVFTSSVASRVTDTSFERDDIIGVSMYAGNSFASGAENVQYATSDGSDFTSQSPITWDQAGDEATVRFMGVYPYRNGAVQNGIYSISLSTEEGVALSENDVMYASTENVARDQNNISLPFVHKLVKVVMQVCDEKGNGLSGATLKINKQRTSGSLDLTDGTVRAEGAESTLEFAANSNIPGEYQTIVMPSGATPERVITITYNGVDYPCPVDAYVFESGKKIIFSATIDKSEPVSTNPVQVSADVKDWTSDKIEAGWIFGEGETFEVSGKKACSLAENVQLSATPQPIGNFEGKLDRKDVYSLEYARTAAEADASISVSGTIYSLPAGKMRGTLLIPVGENVTGFSVSSENEGITLTKVMVYTNNIVGLPITLWTGDGTPGNGIASDEGFPAAGYRLIVARVPLSEEQLAQFVPGAVLQCYFDDNTDVNAAELLWMGTLQLFYRWDNVGKFDEDTHCLTNVVTLSMLDEIRENNNVMILEKNWGGDNLDFRLNRIELKPVISSETEDFSNLLWCHSAEGGEDCYMGYGNIKIGIPASLKSGDKIRITYSGATEGAYLEGVAGDADDENSPRIFEQKTINSDATTVDIQIDDTMYSALLELRNTERDGGIIPLTISGQGLSVHKIQLVRGTEE
ncbi:fimbrillin family protein [Phocaeicola sp.]